MKRAGKLFVISLVAICMGAVINNREDATVGDNILSVTSAAIAALVAYRGHREIEKEEAESVKK